MPNLVAIDVSVTDDRIRLVFSDRAVAAAYAACLGAEDRRPPHQQAIPGYLRAPQLHAASREVSLSLPEFITWFITCRQPDDEDSVTFSAVDADADYAARWAASMVLFEPVPGQNHDQQQQDHHHHSFPNHHQQQQQQQLLLHVRRLWNRTSLLARLEESRRRATSSSPPRTSGSAGGARRSRVASPSWGNGGGHGNGMSLVNSPGGRNASVGGGGGRVLVQAPLAVPATGRVNMGDIWW